MTEPALHNDILREIGVYWAGHRLLYTCKALYTSWNSDRYLVNESRTVRDRALHNVCISTATSCMPNGAYHGKCSNTWSYGENPSGTEVIEYNRGDPMSTSYDTARYYRVSEIINGWLCYWECIGSAKQADMSDVLGIVIVGGNSGSWKCAQEWDVPLRDFIAVASSLVAQMTGHGGYTTLPIMSDWREHMPGTHQC